MDDLLVPQLLFESQPPAEDVFEGYSVAGIIGEYQIIPDRLDVHQQRHPSIYAAQTSHNEAFWEYVVAMYCKPDGSRYFIIIC